VAGEILAEVVHAHGAVCASIEGFMADEVEGFEGIPFIADDLAFDETFEMSLDDFGSEMLFEDGIVFGLARHDTDVADVVLIARACAGDVEEEELFHEGKLNESLCQLRESGVLGAMGAGQIALHLSERVCLPERS